MIFFSYSHSDKAIIGEIASRLENLVGQERVFYDQWSLQPGDSIIEEINNGLEACEIFFFFITKNSLESAMVKLEWQSALMKKASKAIKFIPVKVDESIPPQILLSTVYIDLYQNGLENAFRQMVDVINGSNTYQKPEDEFSNLRVAITHKEDRTQINIEALYYVEPNPRYAVLIEHLSDKSQIQIVQPGAYRGGGIGKMSNEQSFVYIVPFEATSPNFPLLIEIKKNDPKVKVLGAMKEIKQNSFKLIPSNIYTT